jgi:hypothetical protein
LPNFGDEIDFFADFSHIENMQYYAKKKSMHQVISLTTPGRSSEAPYRLHLESDGMEPKPIVYSDTVMQPHYQLASDSAFMSHPSV